MTIPMWDSCLFERSLPTTAAAETTSTRRGWHGMWERMYCALYILYADVIVHTQLRTIISLAATCNRITRGNFTIVFIFFTHSFPLTVPLFHSISVTHGFHSAFSACILFVCSFASRPPYPSYHVAFVHSQFLNVIREGWKAALSLLKCIVFLRSIICVCIVCVFEWKWEWMLCVCVLWKENLCKCVYECVRLHALKCDVVRLCLR